MVKPLDDVKVLELSQMLAGPFVGMNLADLGADVIKIERPGYGEIARQVDPKVGGESYYYLSVNRGKRSVALDLKEAGGRDAFLELASSADVIIENFKPGTVDDLGIGYDVVSDLNPDVVYCSVSGFGQTGPLSELPAVGHVIQAFSGVTSMTRDQDGRPLRVGIPISDLAGAMFATQSILATLRRRDRTGEGDYLDVALSDSMLSFLSIRAGYSHATGEPFPSIGRSHVYFAPESIFETADGYLQLSIVTDRQWNRLCDALESDELAANNAYSTVDGRLAERDELNGELEEIFRSETTDHWFEKLSEAELPVSRLHDTKSVWEDEHTRAREMVTDISTPDGSTFATSAHPVNYESWSTATTADAAALGEHTREVLEEHGIDEARIRELEDGDVIR